MCRHDVIGKKWRMIRNIVELRLRLRGLKFILTLIPFLHVVLTFFGIGVTDRVTTGSKYRAVRTRLSEARLEDETPFFTPN